MPNAYELVGWIEIRSKKRVLFVETAETEKEMKDIKTAVAMLNTVFSETLILPHSYMNAYCQFSSLVVEVYVR